MDIYRKHPSMVIAMSRLGLLVFLWILALPLSLAPAPVGPAPDAPAPDTGGRWPVRPQNVRHEIVGTVGEAILTIDLLYEEGAKGSYKPVVRNIQVDNVTATAAPRVPDKNSPQ